MKMEKTGEEHSPLAQKGKQGILKIIFGRTMLVLLLLALNFYMTFYVMMRLAEKIPIFLGSVTVLSGIMLVYVINTRANPAIKLSWCVLIAVFPVFGVVLYFYVQTDLGSRLTIKQQKRTREQIRKFILPQEELMENIAGEDPEFYNFARYMHQWADAPVFGNTDTEYFSLGDDAFPRMLEELEKAEKFIFLEYFIVAPGYMWDRILEILARKAAEGVDVRMIYDGNCAVASLPYRYPKELERMGIRCKVFSPFRPFVSTHYNNRDHRKILVIDGHTAFTGGINIQDRYINREQVYGHWKDNALMLKGDAARSFTLMFLQFWNADEKKKEYAPYLKQPTPADPAKGYVIGYCDSPMDEERVGEMVYLNILNQAKHYVYIMTPYLILDNEMVTALQFAAKRGVDVRIVLPHIPDKRIAFAMAKSHYGELTEAGVKIYEYTPGFVHSKVFLSDDIHAVVGTINLDYRSLYLHYECAAYLYRVDALKDIREDFEKTMEVSMQVTREMVRSSIIGRLVGRLLKVAAPLM